MRKFLIGLAVVIAGLAGAFWYFSTPSIPRAVLEAKYATPPSQFVMLPDGARAHYRDRGPRDAPVLLLIHGSNASLFTWEPWTTRLDNTFPRRGGRSARPWPDRRGAQWRLFSQAGMTAFVNEFADKIGLTHLHDRRQFDGRRHRCALRGGVSRPASRISFSSMPPACRSNRATAFRWPSASRASRCSNQVRAAHHAALAGEGRAERRDRAQIHHHRCDDRPLLGFRPHGGHAPGHGRTLRAALGHLCARPYRRDQGADADSVGRAGSSDPGRGGAEIPRRHSRLGS